MAKKNDMTDIIPDGKIVFDGEFQRTRNSHPAEKERPLRTVVMLHAEPVWIAIILSTVVIQFQITLYNISFRGRLLSFTNEPKNFDLQSYLMIMDALYCADFLLAWSYRNWKSISTMVDIPPRKTVWLIVDFASLVPVDSMLWYGSNLAMTNPRVFHLWSVNHLLRIYRPYEFFRLARDSLKFASVFIHLLEVLTVLIVLSMTATVLMFEWKVDIEKGDYGWLELVVSRLKPNNYRVKDWFWISFYVMIGHVSSHGTVELPPEASHLPFTIFGMIGALTIRSLLLAYMVDIIHRRDYAKSIFGLKRMILGKLLTSVVTKATREQIYKYYSALWETQGGISFKMEEFYMYPSIFRAECSLELSWDTFKHSKLFRHMSVPFLRNLALLCERKFVLPGDFIIKKFDLKDRMIYIVSGSVHVLSEEDNETPILSLSGGTILGEISLLASYRSSVSVVAFTPCELNVLERNKFTRIIVPRYSEVHERIIAAVDVRLNGARFMQQIGIHLQKNQNIFENNRNTDVAWLKTALCALQGAQRVDGRAEEMRERANIMEKVYSATDIRYTFMYLDTIVMSDTIALTSDAVFLQSSKCPWILKPDSPVLVLWDMVVLVCTLVLCYIKLVSITFRSFETDTIRAWSNFLGLVLSADLWVSLSTAIHKNDRMTIIKVSQILKIRLHDWRFWLDVLAAIPWMLAVSHLASMHSFFRFMRLSRLVKLYKLELMFTRIENSYKISLVALRMIKYSLYIALVSFFATAMSLGTTCSDVLGADFCPPTSWISTALADREKLEGRILSYSMLIVMQVILGIGTPIARPGSPMECANWVILMITGSLLLTFYMGSLTSVRVLSQVIYARHFHLSKAIRYHLNRTAVSEVLRKRVDAYLATELYYDKGLRVVTSEDVFSTLSPEVSANWKYERFGHLISTTPLCMAASQGFIRDICCIATVSVLPPKELLSYGGRHCTEMFIIEKGYCEMIHMEESIPQRKAGPGTAIYAVEMCLQLPVVHTVVTSTYVSFITINRSDFFRVYSNYPEEKFEFDQLMAEFHRMDRVLELQEVVKAHPEFIQALHSVRAPVPSFTFFVYTLNKEDPEYYVINEPFEQLKNLKIIKWLLLRLTLRPDGKFIKFYELQRCICAITTVFFYTVRIVIEAGVTETFVTKVVTFLNISAVLDIYIRMHVGYFNAKGLLVMHPLATATHYIKTSMIVDILGVVPFEQLILRKAMTSTNLFYFYLTRVLQLHRVVGAIKYLQESDSWTRIIKYGKFIPILILMVHVFACIVLYTSCDFDVKFEATDEFTAGIRCPQWQSFIKTDDTYKLSDWIVYHRSLYIASSILLRYGISELQIRTPLTMNIYYIMSSVTFIVLLFLLCHIIADSAIRDGELTAYQDRMRTMVAFLNNKRISPELHDEVVYYFELAWKHKRGQSVDHLLKVFHSALREDVLCALYSNSLSQCPGFADAGETFYRYLLMHMRGIWFYPNGSVVTHYNDVLTLIVMIHTGSAEVIAPDGSFVTKLGPGSIFGNLTGSTSIRIPISIVVTAHSEVLVFNASAFFRALSIHRRARRVFLDAMKLNTDYIRGIVDDQDEDRVLSNDSSPEEQSSKSVTMFVRVLQLLSMRVVDPNWLPMVLWDRNSLFFSCYCNPCMIIYQIAYGDFHIYWICFQYLTDFLFLATMYLKVHCAFEDTHGNIVRDKKRIWIRFIKSPMGFYAHLASIVPFEVISLLFEGTTGQKTFAWLRVNRIIRLLIIVDFFKVQCKRLNINIFKMRLAYLMMILFFIIHLASCLIVGVDTDMDIYGLDEAHRRAAYFRNMFRIAALYGGSVTRRLPLSAKWYLSIYVFTLQIMMYFIYALIVGDMCAMVDVSHYVMNTYERLIRQFKSYMETCDLTYVLRKNLWTYGCSLWKHNRGRQIPHLVLEAPNYLRRSIKNALFIHHLENHKIFSGCHEDFLRQVADHLMLINFFADDLIVNVGDINGDMYFVDTGKAMGIYYDPNNKEKGERKEIYGAGKSFGILSGLFPHYPHRATYRAFGQCKILKLNRRKWSYLLEHFPASKRHIYSIANVLKLKKGPITL